MQSWINRKRACIPGAMYTSAPAYLPDPLFDFPRVWFRDYVSHVKPSQIILLTTSCTSKKKTWVVTHIDSIVTAATTHILTPGHTLRKGWSHYAFFHRGVCSQQLKCSAANGQSPDNQLSQWSNSRKEPVQLFDLQLQLWLPWFASHLSANRIWKSEDVQSELRWCQLWWF